MPKLAEKIANATPLAQLTANDVIEDRQEHLTSPQELIAVPPSITVRAAMELLHIHNITALPVYSHDRPGVIVNIVNTFDLLDYVVSFSQQHCVGHEETMGAAHIQQISNLKLNTSIEAAMTLDSDRESYRLIEVEHYDALDTVSYIKR
jgi:CBS-domain-containing membrane protein